MKIYQLAMWHPSFHEECNSNDIIDAMLWSPNPLFSSFEKAQEHAAIIAGEDLVWDGSNSTMSDSTKFCIHETEVDK